jgi:hypothetical protein
MGITLNDLRTKYNASGVHTVIVDATKTPKAPASEVVRLIAGFSKTGNFNQPYYIERNDVEFAQALYGNLDSTLERKGSFFHRSIADSLITGSILAINLLKTNDSVDGSGIPTADADVIPYQSFATSFADQNTTAIRNKLYSSYFNRDTFWYPSSGNLLATRDVADNGQILNFTNLNQREVSILVRKSTVKGYDIPVNVWYKDVNDIPAYVKQNDWVSDYFVDVLVVAGNFTNYEQLKNDVIFSQYFNSEGLISSQFDAFVSSGKATIIRYYQGAIIPDFRDLRGSAQSIEAIINAETNITGIVCAVDRAELDSFETESNTKGLDLVGHSLISSPYVSTNFLSYKKNLDADVIGVEKSYDDSVDTLASATGVTVVASVGKITVTVDATNSNFAELKAKLTEKSVFLGKFTTAGVNAGYGLTSDKPILKVSRLLSTTTSVTFDLTNYIKADETQNSGSFIDLSIVTLNYTYYETFVEFSENTSSYTSSEDDSIFKSVKSGVLSNGAKISTVADIFYARFTEVTNVLYFTKEMKIELFEDPEFSIPVPTVPTFGSTLDKDGHVNSNSDEIVFGSSSVLFTGNWDIEEIDGKSFKILKSAFPTVDQFVVGHDSSDNEILVRISSIKNDTDLTKLIVTTDMPYKSTNTPSLTKQVKWQNRIEKIYSNYNLFALRGFILKDNHIPNDTNQRVREIYSVMTDTNIGKALTNPEFISWRYFIDTFNKGLENGSKNYLSRFIKKRQKALGFLNTPSASEFSASKNPRFTDSPTPSNPLPSLDIKYIKDGANIALNPDFLFTLPSEEDGSSFVGFAFPNLIVLNSNNVEVSVPPAFAIGNAFMAKWNNNKPFVAVAGLENGIITATGFLRVEKTLDKEDRGNLKTKGINPIFTKGGNTMLYGNSTGYQEFSSTLNNLSSRDILITIEQDTEGILDGFVFSQEVIADETTRTLIETSLTNYLQSVRDSYNAIRDFDIIFDRTNNPDFVENDGASIVDISVTIGSVTDRFISRITLNRSGSGVVAGAFTTV